MGAPIVHFEIMGGESAATRDFYQEIFDWKIAIDETFDYGMISAEGPGIAGGIGGQGEGVARVSVYAQVPDIAATLSKIESLGGKIVMPRTVLPMVTMAMYEDPNGLINGLVEG